MKKFALIGIFAMLPFVAVAEEAAPTEVADVEVIEIVEPAAETTADVPEAIVIEEVSEETPVVEEVTVE
ncbi:MAG: hypothetical protein FWE50_00295 [Alphaproteobacteria bacterium]|nr:hypothetical protein [Alphaproteobacteria bacterium]